MILDSTLALQSKRADWFQFPFFRRQRMIFVTLPNPWNGQRIYLPTDPEIDCNKTIGINVFTQGESVPDQNILTGSLTWQGFEDQFLRARDVVELYLTLVDADNNYIHKQIPLSLLLSQKGRTKPFFGNVHCVNSYIEAAPGFVLAAQRFVIPMLFYLAEPKK